MKILAVDLGKARTGLAVCDEMELLASPVGTIAEYNRESLCRKVAEQARKLHVEEMSGKEAVELMRQRTKCAY